MTQEEFLAEFIEILQRDDPLTMDMRLKDIDEWDSLANMGLTAFLDRRLNKKVSFDDLKRMETVKDVAIAAGIEF